MSHYSPHNRYAFTRNDDIKVGDIVIISQYHGAWFVERDSAEIDGNIQVCRILEDGSRPAPDQWGFNKRLSLQRHEVNVQLLFLYDFRCALEDRRNRQ